MHVPRLPGKKVSPSWPKAFPFRTALGEAGALGDRCPAVLLCPGWSKGRGQRERLFLIQLMGGSITARYSCHSPGTEVDLLLMEQESAGGVASTLPRAQALLEALRRCLWASRQRPKSCQGTVSLPLGIQGCNSAQEKTSSQGLLRNEGRASQGGRLAFWKGTMGMKEEL